MTLTKSLLRIALITAAILLIPLVTMQFKPSHEAGWSLFDFVFAGVLLFGTGATYELVSRQSNGIWYRLGAGAAVLAGLGLIGVNGAVGIIGNENNSANLLFAAVLGVAFVGALVARLRPRGMASAMLAAALVQFLVPVLAMVIWQLPFTADLAKTFVGNGLFVGLWLASALLFRRASADSLRNALLV